MNFPIRASIAHQDGSVKSHVIGFPTIDQPAYCWANFCKMVFYGPASWPSSSYWVVPGTITDVERF